MTTHVLSAKERRAADAPPPPRFDRTEEEGPLGTTFFRSLRYDDPERPVPWDIGHANEAGVTRAEHLFRGAVLDCGCGSGDNARHIASLPNTEAVVAIDASEHAIAEARRRQEAAERLRVPGQKLLPVSYNEADVIDGVSCARLAPPDRFDVLCDNALFHCFGSDELESRYLQQVTPLVKPGGTAVVLACSDENDAEAWRESPCLPRRMSKEHLRKMWGEAGWDIDGIEVVDFRINQWAAQKPPEWLQSPKAAEMYKRGTMKAYLMTATKRSSSSDPATPITTPSKA